MPFSLHDGRLGLFHAREQGADFVQFLDGGRTHDRRTTALAAPGGNDNVPQRRARRHGRMTIRGRIGLVVVVVVGLAERPVRLPPFGPPRFPTGTTGRRP